MQLYALDSQNRLVFANHAKKQCDYSCLECRSTLRMRGGLYRQNHFYHVEISPSCRQNGKTVEHIQAQLFIQKLFPPGEITLEMPFPTVGRIADAAWPSQKLVFEIQCSPISALEVERRNADYSSQGYQVVWILHDKQFNNWRMSAAEIFLQGKPHFFTTINKEGVGIIYDQYDAIYKGARKTLFGPFPIIIQELKKVTPPIKEVPQPKIVQQRISNWPFCFAGDLPDLCIHQRDAVLENILRIEAETDNVLKPSLLKRVGSLLHYLLIRPYNLFFQILLERACR